MLVVRGEARSIRRRKVDGIGSFGRAGEATEFAGVLDFFRTAGSTVVGAAKQAGQSAITGAGQAIGSKLRTLTGGSGPAVKPAASSSSSYLPWILGGVALVGVAFVATRRK